MKKLEKPIESEKYRKLIAEMVKIRHVKKITQIKLADKLGTSNATVARYETCQQIISLNNYFIIMKELGASKKETLALLDKIF